MIQISRLSALALDFGSKFAYVGWPLAIDIINLMAKTTVHAENNACVREKSSFF